MTEETTLPNSWEDVICEFINDRKEDKIIDLLNKKNPKESPSSPKQAILIQLYNLYEETSLKEESAEIKKRKNLGAKKLTKLTFLSKNYTDLLALSDTEDVEVINKSYKNRLQSIEDGHNPSKWLNKYAELARSVSFSTHVAKLTHSSIKKASSFYVEYAAEKSTYLTTNSIKKPDIDVAVDNAAATPSASLLQLVFNGKNLGYEITQKNHEVFGGIADKETHKNWVKLFNEAYESRSSKSSILAKQVYFPKFENEYHLCVVIPSSGLAHGIYSRISDIKFTKHPKNYSESEKKHIPQSASIQITASNHSNASPLNGKRKGAFSLLSCSPPRWNKRLTPPSKQSIFNENFTNNSSIKTCLDILTSYVAGYESAGLSQKHPDKYVKLESLVNQLMDGLTNYIISIHQLPSGWSSNSRLKLAHQYILDPSRDDGVYQSAREKEPYQLVILKDFASWINHELYYRNKSLNLGTDQSRLWIQMAQDNFRRFNELIS